MWTKYIQITYTALALTGAMILGSCDLNGFWGASEGNALGDSGEENEKEGSVGSYRTILVGDSCYTVTEGTITAFHYDNQYRDADNQEQDCFTEALEIQESIGGQAITGIAVGVFDRSDRTKKLKSVGLPDSVKTIGEKAFNDNDLKKNLTIPNSVETIGYAAFSNNKLTSVRIPNGVKTIGGFAFAYNELVGDLDIPKSVETIGYATFSNNKLTSVRIANGLKTIGYFAFKDNLLMGLSIPNSVETIGNSAFANNKLEGNLIIPDSVKNIGNSAFIHNELRSVRISKSVQKIWKKAFGGNPITDIGIDPHDDLAIEDGAFPNSFNSAYSAPYDKPRGTWTYRNSRWSFAAAQN